MRAPRWLVVSLLGALVAAAPAAPAGPERPAPKAPARKTDAQGTAPAPAPAGRQKRRPPRPSTGPERTVVLRPVASGELAPDFGTSRDSADGDPGHDAYPPSPRPAAPAAAARNSDLSRNRPPGPDDLRAGLLALPPPAARDLAAR